MTLDVTTLTRITSEVDLKAPIPTRGLFWELGHHAIRLRIPAFETSLQHSPRSSHNSSRGTVLLSSSWIPIYAQLAFDLQNFNFIHSGQDY